MGILIGFNGHMNGNVNGMVISWNFTNTGDIISF